MSTTKIKRLQVSQELLLAHLRPSAFAGPVSVLKDAIPEDAVILSIGPVHPCGYATVEIVLVSESFPELKPGEIIPLLEPVYKREIAIV